jgi:hypothetical protein
MRRDGMIVALNRNFVCPASDSTGRLMARGAHADHANDPLTSVGKIGDGRGRRLG